MEKSGTLPLISIIVPVYNVEAYLHQCLQSILDQTYTNLEIIVVDDGSTDHSPAICDHFAALDARVKVIHKKKWWTKCCPQYRFRHSIRRIYRFCG